MDAKNKKDLAQAIYFWRDAYKAQETDPAVEKARKSLESAQRRLEKATKEYQDKMIGAQTMIEDLLPQVGQSVIAFGVRAKFTKEYLRVSFDAKVLDHIAETNARFRNLIMPHRKETKVKARVNLEIAEPDSLLRDIPFSPVLEGVE